MLLVLVKAQELHEALTSTNLEEIMVIYMLLSTDTTIQVTNNKANATLEARLYLISQEQWD